jgi:hypothetical protein
MILVNLLQLQKSFLGEELWLERKEPLLGFGHARRLLAACSFSFPLVNGIRDQCCITGYKRGVTDLRYQVHALTVGGGRTVLVKDSTPIRKTLHRATDSRRNLLRVQAFWVSYSCVVSFQIQRGYVLLLLPFCLLLDLYCSNYRRPLSCSAQSVD